MVLPHLVTWSNLVTGSITRRGRTIIDSSPVLCILRILYEPQLHARWYGGHQSILLIPRSTYTAPASPAIGALIVTHGRF